MSPDSVGRRRWRQWRRALIALGILALVGGLVLLRPALHWTIERQLTNTLQAQVRIERVRFSILSAELHLAGLRVFDRSNGRPLLHASSLDLVLRLRSLLRGALDFQTVRIDRPEAWLSLTSAGVAWPVGSWNPSGTSSGWAVAVSDLEAKGGRIHLSDRRSGTEHEETIGEIRIRLRNLSTRTDHAEARVPVSGVVRWRGMTITAEGWVTPFARRPEFSVPVVVRDADLAALRDLLPAGVAAAEPAGLAAGTIELRGARGDAWAADAAFRGEVRTASGRAAPSILVSGDLLQVEGAGRLDDAGVALTQLRASLSDGRLTLRGADGATGEEGERPLAIRQATLALLEPVADLSRPVPFETHVSSSIASTIGFRGSWVSETARLQGRLAVQGLDLEAAQAWLRAAPAWHVAGVAEAELETDLRFVEGDVAGTLSGTSRIQGLVANGDRGAVAAKELDAQSDRFDIALASSWSATGSVRMRATDFRVRDGSETKGEAAAVSATDLESVLRTMRLEGDGRRGLVVTESGEIAVRGMRGRAPSLGIEAVDTGALRANLRSLRLDFTHEGFQGQVSARLSVATASGRMEEGAVRSWAADAVRVESATLSTAPPIVSLGSVEADRLAVEVVRRGQPTMAPVVEPEGRGWPGVSIDRIAVRQGRIAFRDESVRPAWSATLDSVEARIDHLRTDRDAAAELEISAHESSGATLRVSGRLHPSSRRADVRLAVENLDALRPAPYLPEALRHVVRGGTASARLALRMALEGDVPRVEGTGTITLAPLELGDTTRGFTLLLAEQAELQLDRLRLDPPDVALKRVRLIRPWIGLERSDDGAIPTLRLLNELRGTDAGRAEGGGAQAIVTAETLTVEDGTAEIVDRSVQPPFRDRLDELAMTVEGLDGRGSRRMRIELTGVLSDRSTVGMRGSLLPLASQLYLDLEGDIRDFNVPRLNPYTERLTAHRVSQGKLYSRVRYRIEENRLRGENTVRIAQLALGDTPRGTEDRFQQRFGLPLDVVVALLQDASGEISLRVPVSGELDRPEFDLKEAVASAINNALVQVIAAPFSLIGQIVTLGGRLGAIAVDPVRFDPGSFALDGVARAHLDKVAVVMTERPRIAIRLSGWVHPASDEEGLRALRLEERIANLRRADGVASRDEAIDRLFARTFGEPGVGLDPARRLARLRAVERLEERDVAELSDARMLAVYDYLARAGIARERIFLGEGGSGETGRREGDDARRVDFSVLGAYHGDRAPIAVPDGRGTAGER